MKKPLAVFPFLFWVLRGERNRLDGYEAVDFGVAGFVHYPHRSATEFSDDLVSSETLTPASFHFAHRPWLRQNTPASSLWRGVPVECSQPCHSSYAGNHFSGKDGLLKRLPKNAIRTRYASEGASANEERRFPYGYSVPAFRQELPLPSAEKRMTADSSLRLKPDSKYSAYGGAGSAAPAESMQH